MLYLGNTPDLGTLCYAWAIHSLVFDLACLHVRLIFQASWMGGRQMCFLSFSGFSRIGRDRSLRWAMAIKRAGFCHDGEAIETPDMQPDVVRGVVASRKRGRFSWEWKSSANFSRKTSSKKSQKLLEKEDLKLLVHRSMNFLTLVTSPLINISSPYEKLELDFSYKTKYVWFHPSRPLQNLYLK